VGNKPTTRSRASTAATARPAGNRPTRDTTDSTATKRKARPSVARRHFQELLDAKNDRVRQGPSYPPANPYTGRRDNAATPMPHGADASAEPPVTSNAPDSEATFGSSGTVHGRGNQGMRRQS
jgi:hypothetical protein